VSKSIVLGLLLMAFEGSKIIWLGASKEYLGKHRTDSSDMIDPKSLKNNLIFQQR